jgi:hypothetical protein
MAAAIPPNAMPSLQIRCSESEDARLRKLAEDIGADSVQKWALALLLARADQLEKWLADGNYKILKDGRKVFPDEWEDPPTKKK